MSNGNILELQGSVSDQLQVPGCTLQIQRSGVDLVFRIRYPIRMNNPKKGPMLTTEYRLTNGLIRTRQDIVHELPELIELSLVMAFSEVVRKGMDWPRGWPVPTPQQIDKVLVAPAMEFKA
jgi:hypothetical protein